MSGAKPKAPHFVSVILPILNEALYIERTLGAVINQDYPPERLEILVADGMSNDGTREIVKQYVKRNTQHTILIIDNPNRVVPTALNLALQRSRGEIVIIVGGHCEIAPDYVSRCVTHLIDTEIDAVGGPIDTIGETYAAQSIAIAMSEKFGVGASAFRTIKGKSIDVDTVAFPAYRRKTVERVGMFDEELIRNQDEEYNYRIRKMGGRILQSPDIRSKYYSRASLKLLFKQYFLYGFWKIRVLQKHPRQMTIRHFVPPIFVLALITASLLAFSSRFFILALTVPIIYLFANLLASFIAASKHGWKYLPLLPLAFAILHFSYGAGFLVGLITFWNRWGDKIGKTPAWNRETSG